MEAIVTVPPMLDDEKLTRIAEDHGTWISERIPYLAGMIDGDGCISVTKQRSNIGRGHTRFTLAVSVSNTSLALIDWIVKNFGGCVCKVPRYNIKDKDKYICSWTASAAKEILLIVYPFLVAKKERAALAISFREEWERTSVAAGYATSRGNVWSIETEKKLEGFRERISLLNKRGKPDIDNIPPIEMPEGPPYFIFGSLPYTAGLVDSEGSIGIYRNRCRVSVSNTDKRIVDWMKKEHGGRVCVSVFAERRRKDVYQWYKGGADAIEFLEQILPYFVFKRERAEIAIAFYKLYKEYTSTPLETRTPEQIKRLDEYRDRLRQLNRRGRDPMDPLESEELDNTDSDEDSIIPRELFAEESPPHV